MVDFTFKRSVFRIREMAFVPCADALRKNCDVIYLHSSDNTLDEAPTISYSKLQYTLTNDLLLSEEEISERVKKNCKYEIRRATKEGAITCVYQNKQEFEKDDIIDKFKEIYNKMFQMKGLRGTFNESLFLAGVETGQLIVTTNSLCNDPNCVVYHAYLVDGTSAVLMYSASPLWDDRYKEKANEIARLNKHLHWNDILWFKQNGYLRYEWGGISNPDEPNGIDRFKFEFGGKIECYVNYLIPCSLLGRIYVNLVKKRENNALDN